MILRAIGGLLVLIAAMALALLIPAGTLAFVQAWTYLAVFGLSALLITVYLIRFDRALLQRRLEAGPAAEPERRQRVLSTVANVGFLLLFVIAGLDRRFGWSNVPMTLSLATDIAVAAGFVVVFLTFRANTFTGGTIRVAEGQRLADTGPYALVRHPMYAGAVLMLVASPIALGSWWACLAVALMIVAIVARLLDEERYLAARLAGYSEYCSRVRYRLVPFVW